MRLIRDQSNRFIFICGYEERFTAKEAGFAWNPDLRCWWTQNPRCAIKLAAYADDELRRELLSAAANLPDPDKATLLRDPAGVWRYYSPARWNDYPKKAGFRVSKDPVFHWWTESVDAALHCYQ